MNPPVDLVEHAKPTTHALPDAAGHALDAGKIVKASRDARRPGHWQLSAGSKVGAVTVEVPDAEPVTIRIQPKVPIARLFFLLGYSLDPRRAWQDGQVDVAEHPDLLPAFAHAVERQINRALQQGLLQGYRATEETALVVRGRIRESAQMRRHFGATLPVEVAYDEFTTDIAENRILRASVDRLLRLPGVPREVRSRLLHQRARLADATPLVRGQPLPAWQPSRLNARYHQALQLARAVLDEASAEHEPGELRIDGFLFNMNKLFEDFVTVALREAFRGTELTSRFQEPHHLDEASAIRMKPDFVLCGPDQAPLAVADAKYKAEKPGGYPDADLYQMLAYCTALGLREGHLVYAKGNESSASHKVRHSCIVIHQHALDLDQSPRELLEDISSITMQMSTALCV
ncbi:5-methylcytosine-specific restriction enzyme subunit McrC [Streptomyces sp. WMMB 714]|uniref:McrC family protein n=1 Tax=Streptomyces sp. WMMB 714 TaxID=1286822 RepID=UPI0005F7E94D|nr:McrBC 5-methylcytosine restriction system component [Streptomyces sp. WMMB 714]SCK47865.1 5-methylcytosine-specific restriction enzyme subunit McrC [Streptomyces sp. WMMB 714]